MLDRCTVPRTNGSAVVALSRDDFLSYPVVLPDAPVLKRFDEMIRVLDSRLEQGASESDALEATRGALLPRLLSGELSVAGSGHALEATA